MLEHPHVLQKRISVKIDRHGKIVRTMVVKTNLEPSGPQFDRLLEDVVEHLKRHPDIDSAEIDCQPSIK
ncbi:hypothetical protein XH93_36920 [Bradyrhizobium sp. CCBAU 51753]|nr:hypothetical protein XH93_36920 [Bradyrhizobium sp. CCBAU 51753]